MKENYYERCTFIRGTKIVDGAAENKMWNFTFRITQQKIQKKTLPAQYNEKERPAWV